MQISLSQAAVSRSSYVDPNGFVFSYDSKIYRCIYPDSAPLFGDLLENGLLTKLVQDRSMVKSQKSDLELEEYPGSLIIEHETIEPDTHCVEWCPSMHQDAGKTTLDIALELSEHGLALQDAYPWNILFRGTEAQFVDLGSVVPADPHLLWPAYHQFKNFFLRPLILASEGKGKLARSLLLDNIEGIGVEEFYPILSLGHRLRHPGAFFEYHLNRLIHPQSNLYKKLMTMSQKESRSQSGRRAIDVRTRTSFLKGLRKRLMALDFKAQKDPWTQYYQEIPETVDPKKKVEVISNILNRVTPKRVLDLGCNTGAFSILAAEEVGAKVISVDSSELCVESLYRTAREKSLPITPLVANIVCPTPAYGYMSEQHQPLWPRVKSEAVLCLALMHHLHIRGRQSFPRIVDLLDAVTEKVLIFEFVALEDSNNLFFCTNRNIDYSLETVKSALGKAFASIEEFPSDRETRRILLCSK